MMGNNKSNQNRILSKSSPQKTQSEAASSSSSTFDNIFDKFCGPNEVLNSDLIDNAIGASVSSFLFSNIDNIQSMNRQKFAKTFNTLSSCDNETFVASFLTEFDRKTVSIEKVSSFIELCAKLDGFQCLDLSIDDKIMLTSIIDLWTSNRTILTYSTISKNSEASFDRMIEKFRKILINKLHYGNSSEITPKLQSNLLSQFAIWYLKLLIPTLYCVSSKIDILDSQNSIEWTKLYDSQQDGLSSNRFEQKVFAYRAPTVSFIKTIDNRMFFVGADEEWRISTKFWGKKDSFVIKLQPNCTNIELGPEILYFNNKIRTSSLCLQFGLDRKCPLLKLNIDFSDLASIEVWGCGCNNVRNLQQEQKVWEKKQAEKHAKVPLPGNWDENPDRALLEMVGVKTSHAER